MNINRDMHVREFLQPDTDCRPFVLLFERDKTPFYARSRFSRYLALRARSKMACYSIKGANDILIWRDRIDILNK